MNQKCQPTASSYNAPEDNAIGCFDPSKQPIHVRSGSCPSSVGDVSHGLPSNTNGQKSEMFSSHRVRPHKERSSLQGLINSGIPESLNVHRKSQSLDADAQLSKNRSNEPMNSGKRKSYTHSERFKCISAYPPQNDYELGLAVGDIVYVHKKRDNGWFKGSHAETGKIGIFPRSFVEPLI